MGIFSAIVMGAFVYVGGNALLSNAITGTTTGETVIQNILPIVLAMVVIGVCVRIFT